jgi:hypothetical protein
VVSGRALIAPSADSGLPAFTGNDKWGMGSIRSVVWLQPAPAIAKRRLFAV